jgi:hypothetical protein
VSVVSVCLSLIGGVSALRYHNQLLDYAPLRSRSSSSSICSNATNRHLMVW